MLHALLPLATTVAIIPPPAPAVQHKGKLQPPPGLISIEGGPTKIGSTVKYVEEEGKKNETLFGNIVRETPQHEVRLDDFFLMATEVTNEQYAAYVKATGARPPEHWAAKIIDEASLEFVRKQGEEAEKAKAEGRPVPERQKFVRSEWWRKNWEGKAWQIPKGKETHPVVYIDYRDAVAYSRWAGLRLMSEFEFQRAGRGRGDTLYPWGDDADATRSVTLELKVGGREVRPAEPYRVASLQGNRTPAGLYDLCGNVWEWTSSPYSPYPGYKDLQITVGNGKQERKIDGLTRWDANQRVVVGGCFQLGLVAARLTTRRGLERYESTDSVGFRCASSGAAGVDLANLILRDDLPIEKRPAGSQFDGTKTFAIDRWTSEPGTAQTILEDGKPPVAIPGYAVITGYDHVTFVPSIELEATSVLGLGELSLKMGPQPIGILATTKAFVQPSLERGTYIVSYRGKGELEKPATAPEEGKPETAKNIAAQDAEKQAPEKQVTDVKLPEGFDTSVDTLIFYSTDGEPKAWMPAPNFDYARPVEPKATVIAAKRPYTVEKGRGMTERKEEDATLLTLSLNCWVRVSNKGFTFQLPLYAKPGEIGSDWRMR
ncbi:MAG: formylglycine-generating enzyme family protein [Planctomycetes bacterium]|nr:formylglycine-generating enzyme family protein [Planctomycetota bacterium]